MGFRFLRSVGERSFAAHPDCGCRGEDVSCPGAALAKGHGEAAVPSFVPKVKISVRGAKKGSCG